MGKKGEGGVTTRIVGKFLRAMRGFPPNTWLGRHLSATEVVRRWRKGSCFIWSYALSIWLLAFVSTPARAQVLFGSVVGAVTDISGATVPGATVEITNLQTNNQRSAQTDNSGAYTISTVPVGMYLVNISKQGFQVLATNVDVTANNVVRADAQLKVGAVTQTVEISASAIAQLQTDTADVHSEIPTEDRTNNLVISSVHQLPFGKSKALVNHGFVAPIVGGRTINGILFHYSGIPFSVSASGAKCECPGSTQRAEQVKANVAKVGDGLNGNAYFDPSAFAPVTTPAAFWECWLQFSARTRGDKSRCRRIS